MDSFVAHSNFAFLFFVFAAGCELLAGESLRRLRSLRRNQISTPEKI